MVVGEVRQRRFWLQTYVALGAPVAWLMHLGVSFALVPVACSTEQSIWLHLVTIAALAMAGGSGVGALAILRQGSQHELADEGNFLGYYGVVSAGIFLLAILMGGAANFVVSACDRSL